MDLSSINQFFGNIDLQLLDLILQKTFHSDMKVFDAGCGEGRNLMYFLNSGYWVGGVDQEPSAIRNMRFVAGSVRPDLDKDNFQVADISSIPFESDIFDLVIASRILHFAKDQQQFMSMVSEVVRCLKPGGVLYVSSATNIGLENQLRPDPLGICKWPDGSSRFVLTYQCIDRIIDQYALSFLKPWKVEISKDNGGTCTLLLTLE